jgi:hypothetical protein
MVGWWAKVEILYLTQRQQFAHPTGGLHYWQLVTKNTITKIFFVNLPFTHF